MNVSTDANIDDSNILASRIDSMNKQYTDINRNPIQMGLWQ